jgi:hypothetical protein
VINASAHEHELAINRLRGLLLAIFVVGLLGAGGELLLLGHTEDWRQWIPLILMSLSLAVLGWRAVVRSRVSLRLFQATMILFMLSGFIGLVLHYKANVEFELEMYPAMKGWELFWKAIKGATPPTLAPGTMIQLGLVGLAYSYRLPAKAKPLLLEDNSQNYLSQNH